MSRIVLDVGAPRTIFPGNSMDVVTPIGVTVTVPEALPEPTRLVATTEQVYVVPLLRPFRVTGIVALVADRLVVPAEHVAV